LASIINNHPELQQSRRALSRISVRVFVFVGIIVLIIAIMFALAIVGDDLENLEEIIILASLGAFIPMLIWIWLKFQRWQAPITPLFNRDHFTPADLIIVVPLLLFSFSLFSSLLALIALADTDLFYMVQEWMDTDFLIITDDTSLLMVIGIIALVGFIGPVFEEIVFRGLMVERLGLKYSFSAAVIFSSILFGFLHINVVGAALFGFAMCLIYLKTGSLLAPAIIHMLNNLTAIVIAYLSYQIDWEYTESAEFYQQYWWFWLLILTVSTVWIVRFIINHWSLVYEVEPAGVDEKPMP
jgi:uncharacterized protein